MIALLPMYDIPPLRAATDDWWQGLAKHCRAAGLRNLPDRLIRLDDFMALWLSPDLLFGQTCGYPLTHALKDQVALVATPVYANSGAPGPYYCSQILVREEDSAASLADLRGRRAVINGYDSQSGFNVLRHAVAPLAEEGRFFSDVVVSGGHLHSMAYLREGKAEVCAIDSVTYHLWRRSDPSVVAGLRVLGQSAAAPNLPYISRGSIPEEDLARLRQGLFTALEDPDFKAARQALMIEGAEVLSLQAYDSILEMEGEAGACGYPHLN